MSLQSVKFLSHQFILISLMRDRLPKGFIFSSLQVKVLLQLGAFLFTHFKVLPQLVQSALILNKGSVLFFVMHVFLSDSINELLFPSPELISKILASVILSLGAEQGIIFPVQVSFPLFQVSLQSLLPISFLSQALLHLSELRVKTSNSIRTSLAFLAQQLDLRE